MHLPQISIGGLCPKLPVIQGGMGIGISLSGLASAVANAGGIGIISGVQIGFREPDFEKDPVSANIRAIGKELHRARELAPNGIIGMNFMSIDAHYTEYVTEAVKQGADVIISGAGLPLTLPELTAGSQTRIVPIVSSARACRLILTKWLRKHNRFPDAVVVEGPLAGGHLGFKLDDLYNGTNQTLEQALADVVAYIRKFEQEHHVSIPILPLAASWITPMSSACWKLVLPVCRSALPLSQPKNVMLPTDLSRHIWTRAQRTFGLSKARPDLLLAQSIPILSSRHTIMAGFPYSIASAVCLKSAIPLRHRIVYLKRCLMQHAAKIWADWYSAVVASVNCTKSSPYSRSWIV